jgi:hypothetical protein
MTTIEEPPAKAAASSEPSQSVLRPIARMVFLPALGALLGFVLLEKLLLPVIGVGSVERIVQLGQHLDEPFTPAPTVALLGNSITREGIDTRLLAESAPAGWHAQNLAISGCSINEMRVQLPKVLAARPAAIAIGLRPEDLGRTDDMDLDKAFAYAKGGFVRAWPKDWTRADFPGISVEAYEALRSTPLAHDMHFRTALLNMINQEVRLRFRRGLRRVAPDNWTDPYEMAFSVRDNRLERHLASTLHDMHELLKDERTGAQLIEQMAAEIHEADVIPILIILPMHPAFGVDMQQPVADLRALTARLASERSGLVVDALDILSANEFADALHPNAEGREVYSRFVGHALAPLATTSEK